MVKLYILLFSVLLASCVSKKNISKNEIKKDSINIETNKVRIDTIYKERIVKMFEPIYNEVEIPCDTAKLKQTFSNGKTSYKIIKEKGKVKIVFKKDSSSIICENQYKVLFRENNTLKSQISSFKQTKNKEVVKTPFFSGIWKIAFFILLLLLLILLVLWILGITPKYIIKLITKV